MSRLYEGGLKVDVTLATRDRVTDITRAGLDDLYQRGYKVLLHKENVTDAWPLPTGRLPETPLPSAQEFHAGVTEFWFEAARLRRYLLRDELRVVTSRDWTTKEMLLRMRGWHALARGAKPVDVWRIGLRNRE